jgi:hypothetical protein
MKKKITFLALLVSILIIVYSLWDDKPNLFTNAKTGPWSVGISRLDNLQQIKKNIGNYILDTNNVSANVTLDFLADPFFISDSDGVYVFTEHIIQNHGDISCFYTSNLDTGKFEYLGVVLNENFHLSYPQVFKFKNQYYMLPETQRGGAVYLYETDSFPFGWSRSRTLIEQNNVKDPTIFIHNNQIYIFGTQNDHLYVWSSNGIEQSFLKEAQPLLIGSESRPGGRVFEYGDKFILPIQNNSLGYGTGLSLYEIVLSEEKLTLKRIEKFFLRPQPDLPRFSHGMHHLDFQRYGDGYLAVYDGNSLLNDDKNINIKAYLKYLYLNLKNAVRKILE